MLRYLLSARCLILLCRWRSSLIVVLIFSLFFLMVRIEGFFFKRSPLFELDIIRAGLTLLRVWVIALSLMASLYLKNHRTQNKFLVCIRVLVIFLVATFCFNNYLIFYIGFECRVLPVLFLILGWGYQPERVQAGLYLLFYTMVVSLPFLVLIRYREVCGSRLFNTNGFFYGGVSGVYCFILVGAFLVKYPIYGVHLWLPKAHVEAPVSGSIILAGVLLKLGGYGIIRFIPVMLTTPHKILWGVVSIRLIGGVYISLVCLAQIDIKSLIACSSVVHISGCIAGLLCFNDRGKNGCVVIILAHGLCSSGLFYLTGLVYNLTGRRRFYVNKGLLNIMPTMSLWWFLLVACNMACPPTLNLLREMKIIVGLVNYRGYNSIPTGLIVFLRGAYRIFLFSLSQHGKFLGSKQTFLTGRCFDYLTLILHWAPLNLFILRIFFFV